MKARWKDYRDGNHSDEALYALVDSLSNRLVNSGVVDRNQKAWQILGRSGVWPCPNNPKTYTEEMTYLKDWLKKRVAFMDKELLGKEEQPDEPQKTVNSVAYTISRGFTEDIIAENSPVANYTSTTVDAGNVFYSTAVRESGGMKGREFVAKGSSVTYKFADFGVNNALLLTSENTEGTLYLDEPAKTSHLYILGTSTNGASTMNVRINYADGTTSATKEISFADWSVRNPVGTEAIIGLGRVSTSGDSFASDPHYCFFDVTVDADNSREVTSVTFTYGSGYRGFVVAISGDQLTSLAKLIPDMAEEGTSGSEDYTMLFDDDIYTKWCFNWNNYPVSVVFHSTYPIAVQSYIITTANDNATYSGRNARSWEFYGSNANYCPDYYDASWELIDAVEESGLEDKNFTPYEYFVYSEVPYKYFKWTITDRQESQGWGGWNRYIQMSEFDIKTTTTETSSGIKGVEYTPTSTGTYNLQGQKVGENYKGVVIKDGKKTLNR